MPATSEKQKRFFGAVMGAKKGQKGVSGAAKKAAKEMSKTQIKHFLKTEATFDTAINSYLQHFIENQNADMITEVKQRLDKKCWKGYRKQGTKVKGGVRVNNCVKIKK